MKKFDVLVVGELNVDLILNHIIGFPQIGKEIFAEKMDLALGSSSAIFSSNLSSLGAKVTFLGKIGDDIFGELCVKSLVKKGVNTSMILKDSAHKTGATIVMNYGNDRAMITYPGAMEYLSFKDISKEILNSSGHLHLSSVFLQPRIKADVIEIFKSAKAEGLTTSLDPQWDPEEKWDLNLQKLLPFVDIFLPNEQEIENLTKTKTVEDAIDVLSPFAPNSIFIKMGTKGSILFDNGRIIKKDAYINENVVDAIGAGDSFDAGCICKFVQGAKLEECQEYGNLMGALNTTGIGGTGAFACSKDIRKKIQSIIQENL